MNRQKLYITIAVLALLITFCFECRFILTHPDKMRAKPGPKPRITEEIKRQILSSKLPVCKIALEFGLPENTVYWIYRNTGTPINRLKPAITTDIKRVILSSNLPVKKIAEKFNISLSTVYKIYSKRNKAA